MTSPELRNRKQRRAVTMYKLENIFRSRPDKSPLSETDLEVAPPHHMEGEIHDVVFVSVPQTTSFHSCERLREMLLVALKHQKQVMIITHNIELLKATKLDPGDAAAVVKRIQEMQSNDDSSRGGPRFREAGDSGVEPGDDDGGSDASTGDSDSDEENGGETEA